MAKKEKERTKADVIREYAGAHGGLETQELLELIQAERPEMKVSYSEVYQYKRQVDAAKKEGEKSAPIGGEGPSPELAAATTKPTLVELLSFFRKAVEAVGGKDEARKLLDLLG